MKVSTNESPAPLILDQWEPSLTGAGLSGAVELLHSLAQARQSPPLAVLTEPPPRLIALVTGLSAATSTPVLSTLFAIGRELQGIEIFS